MYKDGCGVSISCDVLFTMPWLVILRLPGLVLVLPVAPIGLLSALPGAGWATPSFLGVVGEPCLSLVLFYAINVL